MLDAERINKKLANLEQYAERLKSITPKDLKSYQKSDVVVKSAIERHLQLISDIELDVSALLYKGLELRIAGDDESILDKLEERLTKILIERIRSRRRLRNDLVHAYVDSNYDKEVFDHAHNLADLDKFRKEVNKIIGASATKK